MDKESKMAPKSYLDGHLIDLCVICAHFVRQRKPYYWCNLTVHTCIVLRVVINCEWFNVSAIQYHLCELRMWFHAASVIYTVINTTIEIQLYFH